MGKDWQVALLAGIATGIFFYIILIAFNIDQTPQEYCEERGYVYQHSDHQIKYCLDANGKVMFTIRTDPNNQIITTSNVSEKEYLG